MVAKLQDMYAEYRFATYATEYEVFNDGTVDIYLVPKLAGTYPLTSGEIPPEQLNNASIRVVAAPGELTPAAEVTSVNVDAPPVCPEGTVAAPVAPVAPASGESASAPAVAGAQVAAPTAGAMSASMLAAASVAGIAALLCMI